MKKLFYSALSTLLFMTIVIVGNEKGSTKPSVQFHNTTIFNGYQEENRFGTNIVNIGDFNADGFEDLAVSAEGENEALGAVYIYFGGKKSDTQADVVFNPPSNYDGFGYKVAHAGDFNADGFSDIVIVAKNYISSENPVIMVYFGGPNYDTQPDIFLKTWGVPGFGDDVAGLGDVNGDGIDDIGVVSGSSMGVYFGSLNPPYFTEKGQTLNRVGYNIEYCGDVNGDGYNDILGSNNSENKAFIYKGGPDLDASPDQFFVSPETDTFFGFQLSGGGDINGDGYADVVVGEMGINGHTGKAFVYYGNPNIFNSVSITGRPADFVIDGPKANSNFGSAVAIVKDINGDGFDEVAVGGSNLNYLALYNGGHHLDSAPSQTFLSDDTEYGSFLAITSLDFNGDGYAEVFASNYEVGKVYMFKHTKTLIDEYDFIIPAYAVYPITGCDVNGDGYNDILSYKSIDYNEGTAEIKIYFGGEKLLKNETYSIAVNSDSFLGGLSSIGDHNGDGIDDFAFREFIFYGNRTTAPTKETLTNSFSVITSGDYNNDGFGDVVVMDTNKYAKVIFGGRVNNTINVRFQRENNTLRTLDFNGDGYDDLMGYKGDSGEERLDIFLGANTGFKRLVSGRAEANYYYNLKDMFDDYVSLASLHSLGDMNGDGADEFYLMYRNIEGRDSYSFKIIYGKPYNQLGDLIAVDFYYRGTSYGDINNDGLCDVLTLEPRLGAYFGSETIESFKDKPLDMVIYGMERYGNGFLLDVNNDGVLDLIRHDYYNTYIYFGSQRNKAPHVVSVKDVPADQGGKVTLTWFKSDFDGSKVISYRIERSIAPIGVGFAWEVIGNVPASRFNYYSVTASTLNNEMEGNNGKTYFRITALTDNPNVYYTSNIMSGKSLDNLAPLAPSALNVAVVTEGVKVSWQLNSEDDFKEYNIYRSTEEEVSFDTLKVYGTTADSMFVDETPLNKSVYYFVRGVDFHENKSEASSVYLNITGINENDVLPTEFALQQNYPNPFNPSTTISFAIPKQVDVKLVVYNLLGEVVAELLNENLTAGYHQVNFNASNLSSGVYLYRIESGSFTKSIKMILLK